MLTLFIRNLPPSTTEAALTELLSGYGRVHSLVLARDLFTRQARGTASVKMEGHEARAAIAALDGADFEGRSIYISLDKGPSRGRGRGRR